MSRAEEITVRLPAEILTLNQRASRTLLAILVELTTVELLDEEVDRDS
ncbi:hypothetical protein [Actinokineospora globicatena]|nr:hypothetical protein [Actinokineospora globicatena]MCP2303206.1 hypothetical protein [Actinokineospora globicatena]GLW79673.1 hypothetical protein Aglo01_41540 [Actinokineospora globicatena]GLW85917.1 hypothetical protein Aglo02_35570 [Actinokineospora globicatena]